MIFKDIKWSSDTYKELILYLNSLADQEYQEMSKKVVNTDEHVIGVRIPDLRKIAKEISRGDYTGFIKVNKHNSFEETTLHGLVIGYAKIDITETIDLLKDYVNYIDNWGTNDIVSSSLKIFKVDHEVGYNYLLTLLDDNAWHTRFTLVMLLCHYINDLYIDRILNICNNINIDHYYVKMANAWLISMCYVKQKDKTIKFLKNNKLDYWTQNKAVQKIRESLQVSIFDKEIVLHYKKAKE